MENEEYIQYTSSDTAHKNPVVPWEGPKPGAPDPLPNFYYAFMTLNVQCRLRCNDNN